MSTSNTDARGTDHPPGGCWVMDTVGIGTGLLERLGDARELADRLQTPVGVLIIGQQPADVECLIHHGADHVCLALQSNPGQNNVIAAAECVLTSRQPSVVFCSGDSLGRECGPRLAARCGWRIVSPALMVRTADKQGLRITGLDSSGRMARAIHVSRSETVLVTMRTGVATMRAPDATRRGTVEIIDHSPAPEPVISRKSIAADPLTTDIRHVQRLISGGRGLGGAAGFELLRRVARKLQAGIAASRVAVDLGWIDQQHQVGQTGKTVKPDLYIACGISGASHHLDGMSESTHIVAINTDPKAPIHSKAHLSLVADLHQVLECVEKRLPEGSDR